MGEPPQHVDRWFVVIIGAVVCVYLATLIAPEVAWWLLPAHPSVADCDKYLATFEASRHVPDVERKLDEALWAEVSAQNNEEAYREYSTRFRTGRHPLVCQRVSSTADSQEMEKYLEEFPASIHSCDAARWLAKTKRSRASFVTAADKCQTNKVG